MSQLCLNGNWEKGGRLTWTRGAALEGSSAEAERLLAFYEEGNVRAQGGDLEKALAVFQRGLSGVQAVDKPDAHVRMAEAALLWGLGTAVDRTDRSEEGWRTLLKVLAPGKSREQLRLGLVLNWTHSAVQAGYRHDKYEEVAALVDAFQRLGWSSELEGADPGSVEAVRERYAMLLSFRARAFEGLMQEERYQEAADLATRALETQRECDSDDSRALDLWEQLREKAVEAKPGFRLSQVAGAEDSDDFEDDGASEAGGIASVDGAPGSEAAEGGDADGATGVEGFPGVRMRWDGKGPMSWKIGPLPEDPNGSALARIYLEGSQLSKQGDANAAILQFERGLRAWDDLKHPRSSDGLVRVMMLCERATLQDRLSTFDSSDAWQTLLEVSDPRVGIALPLPLLLNWVQTAVIVAAGLGKIESVSHLLVFLVQMSMHPNLGGADPNLHGELTGRFMYLLEGAYGGLQDKPEIAADWMRALQRRLEPDGLILIPLRELLYHALSQAGRHQEAEAVATEVWIWARSGQAPPELALEWEIKVRAATQSMSKS